MEIQGDSALSVNQSLVILRNVREFSRESAEFIALEVARGGSVAELHEHFEDKVPNPIVVNRWRKEIPQFDLLMREAEAAKAEKLADEVVGIADDTERQAAQAGNAIKARQWMAEKLSQDKFGKSVGATSGVVGGVTVNGNVYLTDEQLMVIAQGGVVGEGALPEPRREPIDMEPEPEPEPEPEAGVGDDWLKGII